MSPLDIPHMTPFQVKTLINIHNDIEEEKKKEIEKQKAEQENKKKRTPKRGHLKRR